MFIFKEKILTILWYCDSPTDDAPTLAIDTMILTIVSMEKCWSIIGIAIPFWLYLRS